MMRFLEILKQTLKIFFKNGKLIIPCITLLFVLANSIIFASYLFSTKLIIQSFSTKLMNLSPTNEDDIKYYQAMVSLMKHEFRLFALANLAFFSAVSLVYSLFAAATISASAEEIVFSAAAWRSWKRTLVTFVHTTLLGLGYALFVSAFVILPLHPIFFVPINGDNALSPLAMITVVVATILYLYLAVVWTLAIVVSVLEERSGFEALWKASVIVKGLRLKGFLLKILFGGLSFAVFQVSKTILSPKPAVEAIMGMKMLPMILVVSISTLVGVFSLISFTVLYFEGKKINEDNLIEMQGCPVEYTKLGTSNIP